MAERRTIDEAPSELAIAIREFWPESEWDNAASIAFLESAWQWSAENNSTGPRAPCGTPLSHRDGVLVTAEHSIGYFQINACNYPTWNAAHFFNVRQNAGTAHALWAERGWQPWYFSARSLGLI